MNEMTLNAYAKINLTLDILSRKEDGYHTISSVMQSISLCDKVSVKISDKLLISCDRADIPCDERNIAHKVATAFFEYTKIKSGAEIHIEKHIPSQAGLGGGSADGAAVLVALNKLYNTNLSQGALSVIGASVGADIPFCLKGSTLLAEGIGEMLSPLPQLPDCYIVIAKPNFGIDTKGAYKAFDELKIMPDYATPDFTKVLGGKISDIAPKVNNMFEECIKNSDIEAIKVKLLSLGALGCAMSGSGSAVFSIFDSLSRAEQACDKMKELKLFSCLSVPVKCGVEEV